MQATKKQNTVRIFIGLFLIFTGAGHLSFQREAFLAQVPKWLPLEPDTVVLLSGGIEIFLGVGLVFFHHQRAFFGWLVAIFLVAVFPGNIAQLMNHKDAFGLNTELLRWLRLPFQPLLIILVLWSSGAWAKWRSKKKINNQLYIFTQ